MLSQTPLVVVDGTLGNAGAAADRTRAHSPFRPRSQPGTCFALGRQSGPCPSEAMVIDARPRAAVAISQKCASSRRVGTPMADPVSGAPLLVPHDDALGERLRRRRWHLVRQLVPDLAGRRVPYLGGACDFWSRAPVQPAHVAVVNLFGVVAQRGTSIEGDALRAVADGGFDRALSKTLIAWSRACTAGSAPSAPAIPVGPVRIPSVGTTSSSAANGCRNVG